MPDPTEHRNAYLILGVAFGASPEQARKAFAARIRAIRSLSSPPYGVEDLTWALHTVEHAQADPSVVVDCYRVPADPDVYPPLPEGLLFTPPPSPMERRTPSADPAALVRLAAEALGDVLGDLAKSARPATADPYEP